MTCPGCEGCFLRWEGKHYRVTEQGLILFGHCSGPPPEAIKKAEVVPPRSSEECTRILAEIASRSRASKVLHEAHETYTTHSQVEKDDE